MLLLYSNERKRRKSEESPRFYGLLNIYSHWNLTDIVMVISLYTKLPVNIAFYTPWEYFDFL